jgi:hypothetical protein
MQSVNSYNFISWRQQTRPLGKYDARAIGHAAKLVLQLMSLGRAPLAQAMVLA